MERRDIFGDSDRRILRAQKLRVAECGQHRMESRIMLRGANMLRQPPRLRYAIAGAVAAAAMAVVIIAGGSGASAAPATSEQERVTDYRAPTGPEITVADAQERAAQVARLAAGVNGALTVTTVHSNFAHAHALLMGESADQAKGEETGPAERVEEMQSAVWVTKVTADDGSSIAPNAPTPRNATGPSGKVLIVVADAHTGFTKELYVGPTSPDLQSLGTPTTAEVPANSTRASAVASVRRNPKQGIIAGKLSPIRVRVPVTVRDRRGHKVSMQRTLPRGVETAAGSFLFRELEGRYTLSAPGCQKRAVTVKGRQEVTITLHCAHK
jgi:hypothetical protein